FGNYEVTATADGDAAVSVAITSAGLSITPNTGDGTLNLQLGSANGSMSANLEVLSGSFILGENGGLTVAKDTELQIDFGGDYVVKFKTTDDAGGKISLGAGGLTFSPTEGDGHLELSVTRNGETRTATLEMTGSLTYKLDGSISLAKDTVVKNIFEDGNILTITANTDASGSMIFDPNSGLYITPSTPDALNVVLTTDGLDVVNISSITGTINYTGGVVTASDGTKAHISYYFGWESELRTTGGTASIQFTADRTVYTANEGSTFLIDYLDGTTSEIQNGTYSDIYATETEDAIELISAGSTFKCNDEEVIFTLESAGSYTLNGIAVTTTAANTQVQLTNYDTVIVDGISYTPLDDNVTLTIGDTGATCAGGKVSLQMEGFDIALSEDVTDGSISYNSTTNKFAVKAGTKSYLGEGKFPDQFVAKNDFDISVTKTDDGKFKFSLGDESVSFDLTRNGTAIMGSTITLDGSILVDPTNNEISLPKDTVLTLTSGTGKKLQITALDDAGGKLTFANGGLRFKPNENDGALEFNFVDAERKATLDVTGAFTYKGLGALSLEDGTVANLTWTDGTKLKITSSGSTGSIGIDPDKGIKITSDDENLSMQLTTANGYSTEVSGLKGSLYYKEGTVILEENAFLTATATLGGQAIDVKLEAIDGDGYLNFAKEGMTYGAGTGKLKVTFGLGDAESTFVVNEGSVIIDNALFTITEGSDLATDLKDFIPALNFKTSEAGTYTINGQKITTSAE
ncbi:MAG: hypothetical protein J5497_00815, partial [Selenomonadaceae bacterium]|nr:hypothetical protein [Selenomonadaceae bacterium]